MNKVQYSVYLISEFSFSDEELHKWCAEKGLNIKSLSLSDFQDFIVEIEDLKTFVKDSAEPRGFTKGVIKINEEQYKDAMKSISKKADSEISILEGMFKAETKEKE